MALRLYKMRSKHWEKWMRTAMARSAGGEDEADSSDDLGELVRGPQVKSQQATGKSANSKAVTKAEAKVDVKEAEIKVKEADAAVPKPVPANPGKKLRKKLKAITDQEAAETKRAEKLKRQLAVTEAPAAPKSGHKHPNRKQRKHLKALQATVGTPSASPPIPRNPSKKQRKRLKEAAAAGAAKAQQH